MKEKMTDHQKLLAMRLGSFVHGETMIDVCEVCAKMIVFALHKSFATDEQRNKAMDLLFTAMRADLNSFDRRGPLQ